MNFTPHSEKQEQALYSTKPITITATGIQWGKTRVGAWFTKRKMHIHTNKDDAFLIVAPTYKVMEQSSLPAFLNIMEGLGEYSSVKGIFRMIGGGTVYFRTAKDPDSVVGITNVRSVWGDEAGKYSRYFWDNIEGRAAFKNCQIILTTSPYSLNWLYKDVIKPHQKKERDDVLYITASSLENPYFPPEVYHKRKKTMDPRRFNSMYGGVFEKMQGLVYDCFDDEENIYEMAEFPDGTKFYGGIDWGYTDPFVLQIRAVTPDGRHYQVSEFYKTQMTITDIKVLCKKKMGVYKIKIFYCDPSQPAYIDELCSEGIPATGANNDIRSGIDAHYELIKSRRFKVLKHSSPLTMSEIETYHWPEPKDLLPDQDNKKESPVDQDNHCFIGDTLIRSRSGLVKIKNIKAGDFVLTRSGYRRVLSKFYSGKKDVITININGRNITCTDNHKFYTENEGFIPAKYLTDAHRYVTYKGWTNKNSKGRPTTYTKVRNTLVRLARDCTVKSIFFTMEKFLTAFMFITKMEIRLIMISRILSLLTPKSTYLIIQENGMLKIRSCVENILMKLEIKLKNGMVLKKALNGISSTGLRYLAKMHERKLLRLASIVVRITSRIIFQRYLNSARINASPLTVENLVSMIFSKTAKSVIKDSKRINIQKKFTAPRDVYNIHVEDEYEFFANDILVSNSMDAARYISIETCRRHRQRQPTHNTEIPEKRAVEERPVDFIRRIRKNKNSGQYENWS